MPAAHLAGNAPDRPPSSPDPATRHPLTVDSTLVVAFSTALGAHISA
jgi:hypothetical protein